MKRHACFFPLLMLCFGCCSPIDRLNTLVNASTQSIQANSNAVSRSTSAIRKNGALVEESSNTIEVNRRLLESNGQ